MEHRASSGMLGAMSAWSVYLVRTAGRALYTGIAVDVERRLLRHREGRGARSLRGRGPLVLVYARLLGTRSLALRVEHRIKSLTKQRKEALVRSRPTRAQLLRTVGLASSGRRGMRAGCPGRGGGYANRTAPADDGPAETAPPGRARARGRALERRRAPALETENSA